MNRTAYLFDPGDVARVLSGLPQLANALGNPAHEGEPSASFTVARKSERQLYRVLGNDHYEHLAALLKSLDFCLGRGFTQPALLKTSGSSNFASALSELGAAEHFLLRGFEVEGLDLGKGSQSVPDFLACQGQLDVAVEVYRPIEWEGLTVLTEQLRETLMNLDVPLDYQFEVDVDQLKRFDEHGALQHVHPATVARALNAARLAAINGPILEAVTERLAAGATSVQSQTEERDLNIRVSVAVEGATRCAGTNLPARRGVISPLGLMGYAPEAMFERLVSERVSRKAAKAQGRMPGRLAVLIVDVAESQVTTQLVTPAYRGDFVKALRRSFGEGLRGYDVIAFCEQAGWGQELIAHFVQHESTVPESTIGELFGDQLVEQRPDRANIGL